MLIKQPHRILYKTGISPSVFLLRIERKDIVFDPGQYIFVNFPGTRYIREYSISSGINDPYLELLIKEVPEGLMSKKLKNVKPGDIVEIEGPFGFFTLNERFYATPPLLLAATGTGISPFRSFVRSNSALNYKLLHGVRFGDESYSNDFQNQYILCTSRDKSGDFHGRITEYLKEHPVGNDHWCYLSGNYGMIEDMTEILLRQGINFDHILSETHN
jgi:ferredoxin--NADP+ reductase/benzoate/toluate 1,2-dioxygenase reductase subunit